MPTLTGQVEDDQIIFVVGVSVCGEHEQIPSHRFQALLDTGCQCTLISSRVINEVGLTPTYTRSLVGIDGVPFESDGYRITLDVPISSTTNPGGGTTQSEYSVWRDLDVCSLPLLPHNFDVLLGMDFIGALHLTLHDGHFIVSN